MSGHINVPEGLIPDVWCKLAKRGRDEHGRECWKIGERNELGEVIGTAYRYADESKSCRPGEMRGLIVEWPLHGYAGSSAANPILVPEGATDTAALMGMEFDAVGLPMAGYGGAMLAVLLAGLHVAIIADADDAGRIGSRKIAAHLLPACASVRIIEPPKGAKDSREAAKAGAAREDFMAVIEAAEPLAPEPLEGDPIIVRLDQVMPEMLDWLWHGRIARGKLTLVAGDPGLGKSFLTLDIAARVSTGAGWPDRPGERTEPGGVVLLNAEDGTADTVVPRLISAGADLARIAVVEGVRDRGGSRAFSFERDLEALKRAIRSVPDCALVVIDPVSAYLGGVDSHKNAEVRGLLAPLAALAAQLGIAIVMVTHLNKSAGAPALYRTMGSLGFTAASRAAWAVVKDKANKCSRLLLPMKNNLASDTGGLAFQLTVREANAPPVIEWDAEPVRATADEALACDAKESRSGTQAEEAAEWLRDFLGNGPKPAKEVIAAAGADGIPERTLRRAKTLALISSGKSGMGGGWVWALEERQLTGEDCQTSEVGSLRAEPVGSFGNAPKSANTGDVAAFGGEAGRLHDADSGPDGEAA